MAYIGDFRLGDTFDTKFCTVTTTGAPTTLAGTPVISAYPGNSTTQLTAGITLTVDFDTVTGLHNVRVVATSGNGYATATNYQLVITTGTVGGTSVVGYVVAEFSIEARSAVMPTTAARTLAVDASGRALSDVDTIKTNPVVNGGTITFPTTATLASTTNITAGTITTATNVTTVNGLAANVLTAAATATDFGTEIATAIWTDTTAGDFTTALSVGKSVMNGVTLGTGLTVARCTLTDTLTTYTGNTVQTGDSFARIGVAGAGLTNIDLPNQTMDITGNITGNLSGSVGSVSGDMGGSVLGNVVGNVLGALSTVGPGAIASSAFAAGAITAAAIATDAIDADALAADAITEIWAKACTEPTSVIAANPTVLAAMSWLATLSRNKITQTATTQILKADDTTTTIATSTVSDDGTTATRSEFV